jgi:eukaryotic-like serine/threonine-protein kinase
MMNRRGLIPTAAVALGIAGASLGLSACNSAASAPQERIVTVTSTTRPSTPAAATTPPATTAPAPSPSTVYVPTPVPAPPEITDPWAAVSAYYGDIESGDYAEAWALLSPSMQAALGPYGAWVAGYQTTLATSVSEIGEAGDTVTISITAEQSDGSSRSYTGYYTVDNGKITSAQITQD